MQKKYILTLIVTFIALQTSFSYTQSDAYCDARAKHDPAFQKEFIAHNGEVGIYEPNLHRAYIDDNRYGKVKAVLHTDRKMRKPWRSVYLGKLVDGQDTYDLYGRDDEPAPVNDAPDADVLTEQRIDEDFLRDFGSGKYTPGDKWD